MTDKDEDVAEAFSDNKLEVSRQRIQANVEAAFNKTPMDKFLRMDDIKRRLNK